MADSQIVKVGVAGLGRSGWSIHCDTLRTLPEQYQVVAVSDNEASRRQQAEQELGCRSYPEFDGLLSDPDVQLLVVATPSHLHAAHTLAALAAGKHVLCEKPMAATLADARGMAEAAEKATGQFSIFQNRRYEGDFQQILKVIASGILGEVIQVRIAAHGFGRRWDWQTLKKYGGGTLRNTGPHFVDQALVLLGDAQPQVLCDMRRALTLGDAEDHVKVVLKAPGAPLVEVEITSACAIPQDLYLVMGTLGTLAGGGKRLRWRYVKPQEMPPLTLDESPTQDRSYNRDNLQFHDGSWEQPADAPSSRHHFYGSLHASLTQGAPLAVTPQQVIRQMGVIQECLLQAPV